MKRFWTIAINVIIWGGIIAYLIAASNLSSNKEKGTTVKAIQVIVKDSARQKIITPGMVKLWLQKEGMDFKNKHIESVNTAEIQKLVASRGFVKDANVYTNLKGEIVIELTQRKPIARVNTVNGYNFYVTDDGYVLPLQNHEVIYVPIVTGSFTPPFERGFVGNPGNELSESEKKSSQKYLFFVKLINFVKFIENSDFWNAQVVQINVREGGHNMAGMAGQGIENRPVASWYEPYVEIVPRVGDFVVMLGSLDEVEAKLDKLMLFYRNVLEYEGWKGYKYIDLRFTNQIVCSKK